jgi:hypothetical protein
MNDEDVEEIREGFIEDILNNMSFFPSIIRLNSNNIFSELVKFPLVNNSTNKSSHEYMIRSSFKNESEYKVNMKALMLIQ